MLHSNTLIALSTCDFQTLNQYKKMAYALKQVIIRDGILVDFQSISDIWLQPISDSRYLQFVTDMISDIWKKADIYRYPIYWKTDMPSLVIILHCSNAMLTQVVISTRHNSSFFTAWEPTLRIECVHLLFQIGFCLCNG